VASSVAIIVNPNARRLRKDPGLVERIRELAGGRAEVHVTGTLDDLGRAVEAVKDAERVILCGGDGTLMSGVTALYRAKLRVPELALAPAGTVATVARNWGQRAGPLETVERVLDDALRPRAVERPSLSIVEHDGTTRVGFQFGTGLVARFFDRYYSSGALGYAAAARIVGRVFVGSFVADAYSRSVLDPLPCVVSVDGQSLAPRAYSLIFSAVVRDAGLHMLVAHRAGEDPDRPHLVASALPPRQLGPQAPRVFVGKPLRGSDCFDDLVQSFKVDFGGGGGPYVLDGDVFHSQSVEVRAGPRIAVVTV
jgi:diacylglycerol kinase family enzyme